MNLKKNIQLLLYFQHNFTNKKKNNNNKNFLNKIKKKYEVIFRNTEDKSIPIPVTSVKQPQTIFNHSTSTSFFFIKKMIKNIFLIN